MYFFPFNPCYYFSPFAATLFWAFWGALEFADALILLPAHTHRPREAVRASADVSNLCPGHLVVRLLVFNFWVMSPRMGGYIGFMSFSNLIHF